MKYKIKVLFAIILAVSSNQAIAAAAGAARAAASASADEGAEDSARRMVPLNAVKVNIGPAFHLVPGIREYVEVPGHFNILYEVLDRPEDPSHTARHQQKNVPRSALPQIFREIAGLDLPERDGKKGESKVKALFATGVRSDTVEAFSKALKNLTFLYFNDMRITEEEMVVFLRRLRGSKIERLTTEQDLSNEEAARLLDSLPVTMKSIGFLNARRMDDRLLVIAREAIGHSDYGFDASYDIRRGTEKFEFVPRIEDGKIEDLRRNDWSRRQRLALWRALLAKLRTGQRTI